MIPTSNSSWITHIIGLERLFALHGPFTAKSSIGIGRDLLAICGPPLIIGSFFTQIPSLMAEPRWSPASQSRTLRRLDQSNNPTGLSDIDHVLDILAKLPALFLRCNEMIRLEKLESSSPSPIRVSKVWSRVVYLQQTLRTWVEEWYKNNLSEIHETIPTMKVNSSQNLDWKHVFSFSNIDLAAAFTMYHSVVILLNSVPIHLLSHNLPDPGDPSHPTAKVPDFGADSEYQVLVSSTRTSVRNICRSIEYYLHSLQPEQAPPDYYLFFPIHVARRASIRQDFSVERAWLNDAFAAMKSKFSKGVWANMHFGDRFSGLEEGLFG